MIEAKDINQLTNQFTCMLSLLHCIVLCIMTVVRNRQYFLHTSFFFFHGRCELSVSYFGRLQTARLWLHVGSPTYISLNLTLILTLTLTLTLRAYCVKTPVKTLPCIQSKVYQNTLRQLSNEQYRTASGEQLRDATKMKTKMIKDKIALHTSMVLLYVRMGP